MNKQNFKILTLSMSFLMLVFITSCNQNKSNTKEENKETKSEQVEPTEEGEAHEEHAAKYQCPMKCEGDKVYDEPGKCPRCKMDLEEVEPV